ncbi:membrane hypothetical protein [Nitrospira sp. ND1]|uniref:hypothetical protein n=1 Tax=Nitrospira sp. ND1 TaxID=1658518 RepID=UPI0009B95899|nr:hypothetical protein [Nitrospira sp. ND1]SLM41747.1 membrane hypothetical protein [Nitrospira sp. ND1]
MKLCSLMSYLGLIWLLFVSFCLAPAESLALETTQYARVVAQAERIAYLAAQRSTLASQVATAALAPSASSFAIRLVAGPVGWAALGVGAGLVLAQMYYSQPDLAAIKTASSTPGGWQVESTNAGTQTFPGLGTNTPANANYPNASIQFSATNVPLCAVDTEYLHDWVVGPFQSVSTAVFFSGNFFVNGPAIGGQSLYVCHRKGIPGSTAPLQDALIPPTAQQAANYVTGLPASDPKSIEAHTNPVGTTGTTQPADNTVSQPVSPSDMPTTVKPKPVPAGDIVVVDSVPPPASTPQQNTQQQTTTTTTTTTQNPDGSTTKQEETEATTSCTAGTHENRTFGTVLQAHQTIWATSGLLSTLNLLKSLTWPSTLPVIALPSALFGNQQVDFNQWAWFFTVLRTLVIAIASFAAYRIIFVGGAQTT